MVSTRRMVVLFSAIMLVAPAALASFQASDLIYVPVVANTEGLGTNVWRSDFLVTNADTVSIDIAIAFLPSGGGSNASVLNNRSLILGGREDDGFGLINEELADIQPNGSVLIVDIVGEYWEAQLGFSGFGGLIVFAYEADTLEDDSSRVLRNAIVITRTYNDTTTWIPDPDTHADFVEVPTSFGQSIPGVPWYNLADPAAVTDERDFSFMVLAGGIETDNFRYNIGILNASDPQTAITLSIQPFRRNGDPFLDENDEEVFRLVTLSALGHFQWSRVFASLFLIPEDVVGSTIKVAFVSWQSTSPEPRPAFVTYGSIVDGRTGDPTTVMGSFAFPYDIECIWPGDGGEKTGTPGARAGLARPSMQSVGRRVDLPAK